MAHDVFISYSSLDKLTADAACATLEGQGIRCWIAPRDIMPGVDWSDAIIDAISECRVMLLLLSAASNASEQVKREVQNAVSEAKLIMPLRIQEVELSKHMRYFIGTPHWMDAMTPPMELHLHRMAQTVGALIRSMDDKGVPHRDDPYVQAMQAAGQASPFDMGMVDRPKVSIPESTVDACATVLAGYIGPLAKVLAKRTARESLDVANFRVRLCDHLSSAEEKETFLKKIERIR